MRAGQLLRSGGDSVAVVKVDINAAQTSAGAVREQMKRSEFKLFHIS
jgi:hypothetical protein